MLIIKKRRALHEERRERTQDGIGHRVAPVVASLAPVRQSGSRGLVDYIDQHRCREGASTRRSEDHLTLHYNLKKHSYHYDIITLLSE